MAYLQKMAIEMMENSTKSQPRSFICSLWKSYSSIISLLNVNASTFCMWFYTMTYNSRKSVGGNQAQVTMKIVNKVTRTEEREKKYEKER